MKLDFFDCNAQIGRYGVPQPEAYFTPQELLEKLQPLGISRALVYHSYSKELHPVEGNPKVVEETKGLPLTAAWAALPPATRELPAPEDFIAQMKAQGVGAVRLFPATHSYCIRDWCVGELFDALEVHRVPIFIDAAQTNYDHIASALESHPRLRLIILRPSYRCDRFVYPLMEKYEHLCLETSNYVGNGGIESICSRFGSSRLIFGTGLPFFDPGFAVSHITYAQIDDADKQAIAAGNLEKLLTWAGE